MSSPTETSPKPTAVPQLNYEEEEIEVGEECDFTDANSSLQSDTTSLSSTIFQYEYENGRRYHSFRAGKYLLPNDEVEQDRLDQTHHLWTMLLKGRLHLAPLPDEGPKRCLDVGAGTGIWTMDFGDQYPECEVIGTDLSPIQPNWVPPNVKFLVDDAEDTWTWGEDSFDYIHSRHLVGAIRDWPAYIKNIYDHLSPGGYVELHESDMSVWRSDDNTVHDDLNCVKYGKLMNSAGARIGRRFDIVPELPAMLADAGFVDITVQKLKLPFSPWAKNPRLKELGRWAASIMETGAEAYGLALFTRVLQMSEEEAKKMIKGLIDDVRNPAIHAYSYQDILVARKPVVEVEKE